MNLMMSKKCSYDLNSDCQCNQITCTFQKFSWIYSVSPPRVFITPNYKLYVVI